MKLPGNGLDSVLIDSLITPSRADRGLIQQENPGLHHHGAGQSFTRCFCPPESWSTRLDRCSSRPNRWISSSTSFWVEIPGLFFQAIGNILVDIEIGEQGIILEDNVKAPLLHSSPGQILPVVANGSRVCLYNA